MSNADTRKPLSFGAAVWAVAIGGLLAVTGYTGLVRVATEYRYDDAHTACVTYASEAWCADQLIEHGKADYTRMFRDEDIIRAVQNKENN